MAFGLKDIVLSIKLALDPASAKQTKDQIKQALKDGTDPSDATENLGAVGSAIEGLGEKVSSFGKKLMGVFVARMILRFVEDSVMAFARFDQQLQKSVAIMGTMGIAMKQQLGDTAREVAKELGMSAEEIVQGYYYLVSAGMNAMQSIRALPVAATFAKAGLMSMKDATEKLALAVTALGYSSKDPEKLLGNMSRVADVMTLASKRSQTTIEQMADALTNKAAVSLRLFHKDVEEGAAALMMFANAGVRGQVAGERLDIFMRQVSAAAIKHADAFKKYGIAVFDAHGKMRNFADISHDMTAAFKGLSDAGMANALSQLGIQQRTQASVKLFIGAEDALRKYEAMMKKANGTTLKIADSMMDTPMEAWNKMKEKIADAKREIGEGFLPVLDRFMEKAGNEEDPTSLVGIMKQFAEGLDKSRTALSMIGKIMYWVVMEPLNALIDAFNIIDDVIVGLINGALGSFFSAMTLVGEGAQGMASMVSEAMHAIGWDSLANKIDKAAGALKRFTEENRQMALDNFESAGNNGKDIWERLTRPGEAPKSNKPRLIAKKIKPGPGRDNDSTGDGDGGVDDNDPEVKAAKKRADKIQALNDALDAALARHTQERVDDEMVKLRKLQEAYEKVYGKNLPDAVKAGLAKLREAIKSEGAAKAIADMFKEEFKDGALEDTEMIPKLQAFISKIQQLKETAVKGSVEWKSYNDTLEKAIILIEKLAKKSGDEAAKEKEKKDKEAEKAATQRMQRIGRITDRITKDMERGFERAFAALLTGSHRGIDALNALKAVAITALAAPMEEYAMNKAKEQMLEAGDDLAKGFSFLADPATAGLAPGMFMAAAKHAAQGTGWAMLAGGASAGAAVATGGASSNYASHGATTASNSTPAGPDINITIDGVDPGNPRHQQLIGDTLNQYAQRGGGNLNIKTKR